MVINSFEDIISWQKAKEFTKEVYKTFKPIEDKIFFDQVYRASLSVMNNIAEGFERGSEKDFIKFLYIAKASCAEVRSMLYLARDLDYLNDEKYAELTNMSTEISKLVYGLIKSLMKEKQDSLKSKGKS